MPPQTPPSRSPLVLESAWPRPGPWSSHSLPQALLEADHLTEDAEKARRHMGNVETGDVASGLYPGLNILLDPGNHECSVQEGTTNRGCLCTSWGCHEQPPHVKGSVLRCSVGWSAGVCPRGGAMRQAAGGAPAWPRRCAPPQRWALGTRPTVLPCVLRIPPGRPHLLSSALPGSRCRHAPASHPAVAGGDKVSREHKVPPVRGPLPSAWCTTTRKAKGNNENSVHSVPQPDEVLP